MEQEETTEQHLTPKIVEEHCKSHSESILEVHDPKAETLSYPISTIKNKAQGTILATKCHRLTTQQSLSLIDNRDQTTPLQTDSLPSYTNINWDHITTTGNVIQIPFRPNKVICCRPSIEAKEKIIYDIF